MQKEVDEKLFLNICFPTPYTKTQKLTKSHQISIRKILSDFNIVRKLISIGFSCINKFMLKEVSIKRKPILLK